jgi:hypothetical protein
MWKQRKDKELGTLPGSQHFGVERCVGTPEWGLGIMASKSITRTNLHNQTTSWLVHSWSTLGAHMSHGQTLTHKTHHGKDLGEATTFPLIVFYVLGHGVSTQISFLSRDSQVEVPKFPTLGLLLLWRPITSFMELWSRWGLNQSYSPCEGLSNGIFHATWT